MAVVLQRFPLTSIHCKNTNVSLLLLIMIIMMMVIMFVLTLIDRQNVKKDLEIAALPCFAANPVLIYHR